MISKSLQGGLLAALAIPAGLSVPDDLSLLLTAKASGVQIYMCDPASTAWKLKGPDAALADESGKMIGKHYGGPTWELADGSLVTGEVTAKDPGPSAAAIPWLLLKVASNGGKGRLAGARAIQRVATEGGVAPGQTCQAGQEIKVPYRATYLFYGKG
jgi:hypothetical protein